MLIVPETDGRLSKRGCTPSQCASAESQSCLKTRNRSLDEIDIPLTPHLHDIGESCSGGAVTSHASWPTSAASQRLMRAKHTETEHVSRSAEILFVFLRKLFGPHARCMHGLKCEAHKNRTDSSATSTPKQYLWMQVTGRRTSQLSQLARTC